MKGRILWIVHRPWGDVIHYLPSGWTARGYRHAEKRGRAPRLIVDNPPHPYEEEE